MLLHDACILQHVPVQVYINFIEILSSLLRTTCKTCTLLLVLCSAPVTLAEAWADAVALAMAESKAWPEAAAWARLLLDVAPAKALAMAEAVAVATAFAVEEAWALPMPPAPTRHA